MLYHYHQCVYCLDVVEDAGGADDFGGAAAGGSAEDHLFVTHTCAFIHTYTLHG